MLLRVDGSCCAKFETGQTFSCVQTDAITPNPNHVGPGCRGLYEVIYMLYMSTDHGQLLSICGVYLFTSLTVIFFPETRNTSNKMRVLLARA